MYIEYTPKVNAFSVEKGVLSVTYTPVDSSLDLPVHHIQQLGVHKQDMVDFSTGTDTQEVFQTKMRKSIVDAATEAQYRWNGILSARKLVIPTGVEAMLGVEWPVVTETESLGNIVEVL